MDYNNDFKHDLEVGQVYEKKLGGIFENSKIEVKADFMAYRTGNVFIEFESRGKKSGISISESDYYAIFILNKMTIEYCIMLSTKNLKKIARKYFKKGKIVKGGDLNTSKGVLIPLKKIVTKGW